MIRLILSKLTSSFIPPAILLVIYAICCIIATFLEQSFGTLAAKAIIYQNPYFHALSFFILIYLILFCIKLYKGKKYSLCLLHFSFILIILGAFLTMEFALQGGIHLKLNQSSNEVFSKDLVLKISKDKEVLLNKQLLLSKLYSRHFSYKINKNLQINFISFTPPTLIKPSCLVVELVSKNGSKRLILSKNAPLMQSGLKIYFGNASFLLPFILRLDAFVLNHYAGSLSPSSFYSKLSIITKNKPQRQITVGNAHFVDIKGYRIFQSAYDLDAKGSIFAINKDPGKLCTYAGYAALILGFLCSLFSPKGRLKKLSSYLNKSAFVLLFALLFLAQSTPLKANTLAKNTEEITKTRRLLDALSLNADKITHNFARLSVQGFNGRVSSMDTFSLHLINKISHKSKLYLLNHNEIFASMMVFPKLMKNVRLIYTKSSKLARLLGTSSNLLSFNDFFDNGQYKLKALVKDTARKARQKQSPFERELLKTDERVNIAAFIFSGEAFRVGAKKGAWSNISNMDEAYQLAIESFFYSFKTGVFTGKLSLANEGLKDLYILQAKHPSSLSKAQLELELLLNFSDPFRNLFIFYLCFSLLLFIICIYFLLSSSLSKKLKQRIYSFLALFFFLALLVQFSSLIARFFLASHAPLSDAYESMIYISFICALIGAAFYKKNPFVLIGASFMAGMILFCANLSFIDSQITPLVPVLKSPWLNLHVSMISASYAFFGLNFILGIFSLICFLFTKLRLELNKLACINELFMQIGLALLSIGTFLGAIWANESWGRYWGFDAKETWSLISIIVYALLLHLRLIKKSIYFFTLGSVFAFFSILMTYFGVNFYLSGLHSYGKISSSLPLAGVLIFLILLAFLALLAARKRNLVRYEF